MITNIAMSSGREGADEDRAGPSDHGVRSRGDAGARTARGTARGSRVYTLLADELPDVGAFADDLADSVIRLDVDAATAAIRATGNSVRIIDSDEIESDFVPTRMNLWVEDDIVTFAQPF